ncbi:MAG TPA: fibronectin type III domain-containing protein [Acidobacteriota bacterium]|nr:fibronectin type III domain-containing protein [Acidobacteriota bacterium]
MMRVSLFPVTRLTRQQELVGVASRRYCDMAIACLAALLIVAGCAKVGEPQPPAVLIPKPATDLAASQYSDTVVLSVSMPSLNTNGSPVTTLMRVEVFRLTSSRGLAAPLPEADYLKTAEMILSISADKFATYLNGKAFVIRDQFTPADRSALYDRAFDYALRFVNRKMQTAGLSNQVIILPTAIPTAPAGLSAKLTQEYVRLTWDAPAQNMDGSTPPHIAGYNVYRSEDPRKFSPAPLNPEPLQQQEYDDRSFQFDKTYYYEVSVVGSRRNPYAESVASPPVTVMARDIFAPGPPQNLNAVAEGGVAILLWVAPPDPDVAGYRVYRTQEGASEKRLLSTTLIGTLSFRDESAQAGRKYDYYVTAVDSHGNESVTARTSVEVP